MIVLLGIIFYQLAWKGCMLLFLRKKSNQKSRRQRITAPLSEEAMWIFCATVTSAFVILLLELKSLIFNWIRNE